LENYNKYLKKCRAGDYTSVCNIAFPSTCEVLGSTLSTRKKKEEKEEV
jgi:hypothetical protein